MINLEINLGLLNSPHQRVKTPTIMQMDAMECGAVCLAIILAYYGLYVSPEEAREACGVSRDGSKAINIIKAARSLGMEATGKRIKNLENLRYLQTPFIIYWKFEHFLVVEGIKKNKVYINDPATGPRVISLDELDKYYTGVVLTVIPGAEFKPGGTKEKSVFNLLNDYMKDDYMEIAYLLLTSLLLAIPQAAFILLIQFFIDNIVIKKQGQWMIGYMTSLALVTISTILLLWIQKHFLIYYKIRFAIKEIPYFFNKLIHLPLSFYTQRSSGDIANRIHIFDKISTKITALISECITDIFHIIIYSIIITLINPILGLITFLITLLNFTLLFVSRRKIIDLGRRTSQDHAKVFSIEYGGVLMIETLKFMNAENQFFTRWLNFKVNLVDSLQKIDFYSALISMMPGILYYLNQVILIILGIYFILQGTMSVGGLIAIYTLLLLFSGPILGMFNNFIQINELKADIIRVNDVLLAQKQTTNTEKNKPIESNHLINIKDIYFGYSKLEAPILSGINLNINKGDMIAITGVSGGGKSSLLNLICGLFEPWKGAIYLKGKPVQNYDSSELFKIISYVDQNIFLFEGTIRENLSMWDDSIADETLIKALHTACLYDTFNMVGGLDYHIEEGGQNISLGQAQRFELARAFIREPELLLLDEATSALDSITEAKIYENLRAMNCSVILVAHRLGAIKHCNEIIIIEKEGIIERGSHEELIKLNGKYKELISGDYLS